VGALRILKSEAEVATQLLSDVSGLYAPITDPPTAAVTESLTRYYNDSVNFQNAVRSDNAAATGTVNITNVGADFRGATINFEGRDWTVVTDTRESHPTVLNAILRTTVVSAPGQTNKTIKTTYSLTNITVTIDDGPDIPDPDTFFTISFPASDVPAVNFFDQILSDILAIDPPKTFFGNLGFNIRFAVRGTRHPYAAKKCNYEGSICKI